MDDDLDLSWIREEQDLLEGPAQSKKRVMSDITFHCIYIDSNQEIVSNKRSICSLEVCDTHSILSNSRLLKYIKDFQRLNGITYKLGEIFMYHINIDFENVQAFLSYDSAGSFSTISMFEDLIIEPSLSIFHEINEIYMVYQEKSVVSIDLVSIMKTELNKKSANTKKVRIADHSTNLIISRKRSKHTRKKG
jgi:hypothetical protein